MTTNHHVAVPTNAPLTAAMLEDRYSDLDAAITGIQNGDPIDSLNLTAATTLTIASGSVTRTQSRHMIDTEGAATTDDLTTIAGGANGDRLIISAANTARSIVIKHGTGNIKLFSKLDITLDDDDLTVEFQYDGADWQQVNGLPTVPVTNNYRVPADLALTASRWVRNSFAIRAGGSTGAAVQEGIAAPVTSGTATASNDTDSSYSNFATGNVATNPAGLSPNGGTYNNFRFSHDPLFSILLRTVDITAVRMWFGISSAAPGNVDTIAGATEAACFRFSSVAGDAGWTPVTKDATTQNTGSALNTTTTLTAYLLQIKVDSANSRIGFSVNNGTVTYLASNLPASSTELSFFAVIYTQAAAIKNIKISRLVVEYN